MDVGIGGVSEVTGARGVLVPVLVPGDPNLGRRRAGARCIPSSRRSSPASPAGGRLANRDRELDRK
jgi:hypothetical protein